MRKEEEGKVHIVSYCSCRAWFVEDMFISVFISLAHHNTKDFM